VASAPLVGAVPAVAAVVAFRTSLPPESLALVFVEAAVVGALYLAAACSLGLDSATRLRYVQLGQRLATSLEIDRIRTAGA
jgi:hypothetical protein